MLLPVDGEIKSYIKHALNMDSHACHKCVDTRNGRFSKWRSYNVKLSEESRCHAERAVNEPLVGESEMSQLFLGCKDQ